MNLIPPFPALRAMLTAALFSTLGYASDVSVPRIILIWDDNSIDESGFIVERAELGKPFTKAGTVAANITTYSDYSVVLGVEYSYRIRAYNNAGESAPTNAVTAFPSTSKAGPPSNVKIGITLDSIE